MHPKTLFAMVALASAGMLPVARLGAQDVTATPLTWVDPTEAPDELPLARRKLDPGFPSDLRHASDPGYVILRIFVDDQGKILSQRPSSTLAAYEDAVIAEARDWKLKPGRRAGQPVDTYVTCAVIFNPASADRRHPDATPRVLAVKEVIDPARHQAADEVVWGTVSIDAAGKPTAVKDVPDSLSEPCREALQAWAFAPARRGGRPVAAELRVPFVVTVKERMNPGEATPPRVVKQVKPEYPPKMRRSGLRGEVVMSFIVDPEGRVTQPYVVRSLNPEFDEPALTALRQWKYEPGRRNGVPRPMRMQVSVMFEMPNRYDGGDPGMTVRTPRHQEEMPPEYQYDVAPKPRGRVRPVYPYELLNADVSGKAQVRFAVSPEGKVVYTAVGSADRPEFGGALQAAIDCFEFEPALKNGRPNGALLNMEQRFSRYDDDGVFTREDREAFALEHKHPERVVGAGKLDGRLRPVSQRPPVFPVSLNGTVDKGEAVVEMLVDDEGQARLPRVISASAPAFGWSAVQAVSAWRFDPPKSGGKPVFTRVRVPFRFSLAPSDSKAH